MIYPRISRAAPLQAEQEADEAGQKEELAKEIKFANDLLQGQARHSCGCRLEDEGDDEHRDTSDG